MRTLPTEQVGYDEATETFFLKCDNPDCNGERMVGKDGDDAGIESIRGRLQKDGELIDKVLSLHGTPKILLRNAVPVNQAVELADDYEISKDHIFEKTANGVSTKPVPFAVTDDEGEEVLSLTAPPVVLQLIDQLVGILGL